ncbi:MAG TPA: flavodoxin, partial [Clostridiales bacterium]|nr:flavodoxin [Clostridiales bacterium]
SYDTLILGCPAMGAEVLEESEFEPFFAELEPNLSGKNIALFGSYGWGDGEWMREWEKRVTDAGGNLIGGQGLIVNDAPDDAALDECKAFGESAAK